MINDKCINDGTCLDTEEGLIVGHIMKFVKFKIMSFFVYFSSKTMFPLLL